MKAHDAKMIVSIKYCGGCNPEYDRVALVEQIKGALKGKVKFVSAKSEGVELIIAVQGCAAACADLSSFEGIDIKLITKAEDAEKLIGELNEIRLMRSGKTSQNKAS